MSPVPSQRTVSSPVEIAKMEKAESMRIRKIASVPNQSHLDSEGFICTETSLEFFFAFIHKKEKKNLVAEEIARC